ncbi:MAG: hypothetical protein J7M25_10690 [Deltaproteobacteria bacterium]|nr:hypothetical protein [Deltaproteobacteria bacterium]
MARVLQCSQCGAPLRSENAVNGYVRCEYCGNQTSILPEASNQVPSAVRPQSTPPNTPLVTPPSTVTAASSSKTMLVGTLFSILLAIGMGFFIYTMQQRAHRRAAEAIQKATSSTMQQRAHLSWSLVEPACLLRVNHDDVLDVGMLARYAKEEYEVHFLDGKTGKLLGKTRRMKGVQRAKSICLGPLHMGVVGKDLRLRIVSAKTMKIGPRVTLRDRVTNVAANDGCAAIRTADRSVLGLSLPDAKPTQCKAGPLKSLTKSPGMPTFVKKRIFVDGKTKYRIDARRAGSPVLTVSARQGKKTLWKRELDITATNFGIPALLTHRTVMIVGALHPRHKKAYLVGLDLASGERRYHNDLDNSSISTFGCAIVSNGPYAIIWSHQLIAVDPASGRIVWRAK